MTPLTKNGASFPCRPIILDILVFLPLCNKPVLGILTFLFYLRRPALGGSTTATTSSDLIDFMVWVMMSSALQQ